MSASAATLQTIANPFPGPRPFRESEQHLFFGRESRIDSMVDKLAGTRFLAVVGTSGSGKSSLVNCGLKPAIQRGLLASAGTSWRVVQVHPGANPIRSLACGLAGASGLFPTPPPGLLLDDMVEAILRLSGFGLVEVRSQARMPEDSNLLVVVDQFEEIFRYRNLSSPEVQGSNHDAAAFVRLLLEAAQQKTFPIYVVLTMRSDFLGDCSQFHGLPEAVSEGQYLIPRMTRDERRSAIEGPIAVAGSAISPVLLNRLVNDVGDIPDQLSVLQHAMNRTWAHWSRGERQAAISVDNYEAIGGMAQALDRHAEKAYGELGSDRAKLVCERIFKALTDRSTDPRGVRRPCKFRLLCEIVGTDEPEVLSVIEVFRKPSRSFLFPDLRDQIGPDDVIDISHESLMRIWTRLRKWANQEAEAAREYHRISDRAAGYRQRRFGLMQDPDLQTALRFVVRQQPTPAWAELYGGGLAHALEYLRESEGFRDRQRLEREIERRWHLRWQPIIFACVAACYLLLLLKYRDLLLPPASDLKVRSLTEPSVKDSIPFAKSFFKVGLLTAAAAGIYTAVIHFGEQLYLRAARAMVLGNIRAPKKQLVRGARPSENNDRLGYASVGRRLFAFGVDLLVAQCLFFQAIIVDIPFQGRVSQDAFLALVLSVWFFLQIGYHALTVGSSWRATFGMLALRVCVTDNSRRKNFPLESRLAANRKDVSVSALASLAVALSAVQMDFSETAFRQEAAVA